MPRAGNRGVASPEHAYIAIYIILYTYNIIVTKPSGMSLFRARWFLDEFL